MNLWHIALEAVWKESLSLTCLHRGWLNYVDPLLIRMVIEGQHGVYITQIGSFEERLIVIKHLSLKKQMTGELEKVFPGLLR